MSHTTIDKTETITELLCTQFAMRVNGQGMQIAPAQTLTEIDDVRGPVDIHVYTLLITDKFGIEKMR